MNTVISLLLALVLLSGVPVRMQSDAGCGGASPVLSGKAEGTENRLTPHETAQKSLTGAVRTLDTAKPKVALTFDDGPSAVTTEQVLEALRRNGARATFFIVGEMAEKNPEIVRRMWLDGNEIGNHTYSHPNLKTLSLEAAADEFARTDELISLITGCRPAVVRAPGGNVCELAVRAADGRDFVGWTVDTKDWKYRSSDRLIEYMRTVPLQDGDIILMHDIHLSTANAVDAVLKVLRERGFETVTVSELKLFGVSP